MGWQSQRSQITCVTFAVKDMHLCPILHDMNSMYKVVVDSNKMGIVMVTVEDNACKSRTTNTCLNWKLTWQQSLDKELGAKHMINHRGAILLQKLPPRLVFKKYS